MAACCTHSTAKFVLSARREQWWYFSMKLVNMLNRSDPLAHTRQRVFAVPKWSRRLACLMFVHFQTKLTSRLRTSPPKQIWSLSSCEAGVQCIRKEWESIMSDIVCSFPNKIKKQVTKLTSAYTWCLLLYFLWQRHARLHPLDVWGKSSVHPKN